MVAQGRQLLLALGLVLFSAGLAEQGLRSSGTGSAEAAGEGVFSSMFGQLRHALSLQPSEKPAPAVTSLYESLENHSENTSTGQVFTVTLNSELQEAATAAMQREVKAHS